MSRQSIISILLVLVGLVNFVPVAGVFGAESLARLYGFAGPEGDLLILLRHRALLFGIVGAFVICSAFRPGLQPAAMLMAGVSMAGFIALVFFADEPGAILIRVAVIDLVALAPLIIATALYRQGRIR